MFFLLQCVYRVHLESVACSAAAVHRVRPATTLQESVAALLELLVSAVSRVRSAALRCFIQLGIRICWSRTFFDLGIRSKVHHLGDATKSRKHHIASLCQLVSQEHSGETVTRSASVQRPTSSATRCLDHVTAHQVSTATNVTKV